MQDTTTDVVVVGAGNAGLVAALAAHERGARVLVLESADMARRGGNSRFSGGIFRAAHDGLDAIRTILSPEAKAIADRVTIRPYPASAFRADWLKVCEGLPDRALIDTVIEESFATLEWMQQLGVQWEICLGKLFDESRLGDDVVYDVPPGGAIRAIHEGVGLMERLFAAVEKRGIEVWYGAPAAALIMEGSTARGVRVRGPDGFVDVRGAVVLACGGFESNPEMRLRYLGAGWDLVKVRGTRYNMGTMLAQALAVGAQPAGHWGGCHAAPIDAAAPAVGDLSMTDKYSRYSYPYSLMVNVRGERFIDEGEDQVWLTYAKTGSAIRRQPRNVAYQIFDQKTAHLLEPRYSTGIPVVADTIAELADALRLPGAAFKRTIETFNRSVSHDALERFDPLMNDQVRADPDGQPPKSNWALRLDDPPFVAYSCACGITFTYGGLKIDTDARVLDTEGRPMPGLFATGEMIGDFFYFNYAAGTGLMRGAVFGRRAGERAAAMAIEAS